MDDAPLEVAVAVTVGQSAQLFDPLAGDLAPPLRGHIATVQFKLIDWEQRRSAASALEQRAAPRFIEKCKIYFTYCNLLFTSDQQSDPVQRLVGPI